MPVYKDEDRGTWYVSIRYKNWAGKADRKVKRGFKRERDAKQWERTFLSQQAQTCDMTFGALSELYFEDMSPRLKESTIDTKRNMCDTKILPYFKDTPVNEITPASIRRWQNELMKKDLTTGKKYAPTYLKTINAQLSAILNYAVKFYNLRDNPCRAAGSMGKKKADEMKIWTIDQFNAAMEFVPEPSKRLAFTILFWCGLREGECLALQPVDILKDGSIRVKKTYKRKHGEDGATKPKTDNSVRICPAPGWVIDEIRKYIASLYNIESHDRIFYFTKSTLNKALNRAAAEAGLPRIRVHDLRHSHAAMLIELGYSIVLVAERLGDTVKVAMETYSHLYPNKQKEVAKNLEKHRSGIIPVSQDNNKAPEDQQ